MIKVRYPILAPEQKWFSFIMALLCSIILYGLVRKGIDSGYYEYMILMFPFTLIGLNTAFRWLSQRL